jgi:hypothetical protein
VGIDWFQGTFPYSSLDKVSAVFSFYLQKFSLIERPRRFRALSCAIEYTSGHRLCFDPDSSWGFLESNGSAIAALGESMSLAFLSDLIDVGCRLTRVDVFRDDYAKVIHPSVLFSWAKSGLLRRFQRYGYHESHDGSKVGATFTAGSRGANGAGTYIRYYDKSQHPTDVSDCYRLEVEITGSKAQVFGRRLHGLNGSGLEALTEFVESVGVGALSFSALPKQVQLSRAKCHPEWASWCGRVSGTRIRVDSRVRSLASSLAQFSDQWGGLLANLLSSGTGFLFGVVSSAIRSGRDRGYQSGLSGSGSKLSLSYAVSRDSGDLQSIIESLSISSSAQSLLEPFLQLDLF